MKVSVLPIQIGVLPIQIGVLLIQIGVLLIQIGVLPIQIGVLLIQLGVLLNLFVCFGLILQRWLSPLFEFIIIYLFPLPARVMSGSRGESQ